MQRERSEDVALEGGRRKGNRDRRPAADGHDSVPISVLCRGLFSLTEAGGLGFHVLDQSVHV